MNFASKIARNQGNNYAGNLAKKLQKSTKNNKEQGKIVCIKVQATKERMML